MVELIVLLLLSLALSFQLVDVALHKIAASMLRDVRRCEGRGLIGVGGRWGELLLIAVLIAMHIMAVYFSDGESCCSIIHSGLGEASLYFLEHAFALFFKYFCHYHSQ
jgi:hypothetical protein